MCEGSSGAQDVTCTFCPDMVAIQIHGQKIELFLPEYLMFVLTLRHMNKKLRFEKLWLIRYERFDGTNFY